MRNFPVYKKSLLMSGDVVVLSGCNYVVALNTSIGDILIPIKDELITSETYKKCMCNIIKLNVYTENLIYHDCHFSPYNVFAVYRPSLDCNGMHILSQLHLPTSIPCFECEYNSECKNVSKEDR